VKDATIGKFTDTCNAAEVAAHPETYNEVSYSECGYASKDELPDGYTCCSMEGPTAKIAGRVLEIAANTDVLFFRFGSMHEARRRQDDALVHRCKPCPYATSSPGRMGERDQVAH